MGIKAIKTSRVKVTPLDTTTVYQIEITNNTTRTCRCIQCGLESESDNRLPMFESTPEYSSDAYYCGCYGWE